MTIEEAIKARHSVRRYVRRALEGDVLEALEKSVADVNGESGLHIQLVTGEPKAFTGPFSYGVFSGVENYFVVAGRDSADLDEKAGYFGERLVLLAQTLGLNTCWVGLSYRKVGGTYSLARGERIVCYIALGYGESQGSQKSRRRVEDVSNASDITPSWFRKGVELALLAPTAVNQQKFFLSLEPFTGAGKFVVKASTRFSVFGYTKVDLGIVKYHFEVGAGKGNFIWD